MARRLTQEERFHAICSFVLPCLFVLVASVYFSPPQAADRAEQVKADEHPRECLSRECP